MEQKVARIHLKQVDRGFHVISVESVFIGSLSIIQQRSVRNHFSTYAGNNSIVIGVVIYRIEALRDEILNILNPFILGDYSTISQIQEEAKVENTLQLKWIEKLNRE
jgi:hypothetical protein